MDSATREFDQGYEQACDRDRAMEARMLNEEIAKICHEANRAYCEILHDFSQSSWEQAPDWQRRSAINGVEYKLASNATPRQSHENWLKMKTAEGWQWGPVKDPTLKLHPCCVEYDMLPEDQRRKDAIFTAIVQACSPVAGDDGYGLTSERGHTA